jgi:hypothetical protein
MMSEKGQIDLPAAVWLVPAVALLIALAPLPYGYYTLMRIVVCGAAGFLAYSEYSETGSASFWVFLMGGLAVLFNPIIPIHLGREIWVPVDVVASVAFFIHWRVRR